MRAQFLPGLKEDAWAGMCHSSSSLTLILLLCLREDENEGFARGIWDSSWSEAVLPGHSEGEFPEYSPWAPRSWATFLRHDTNVLAAAWPSHLPTEPPGTRGHRCCGPTTRLALVNPGQAVAAPRHLLPQTDTHSDKKKKSKQEKNYIHPPKRLLIRGQHIRKAK